MIKKMKKEFDQKRKRIARANHDKLVKTQEKEINSKLCSKVNSKICKTTELT